MQVLQTAFNIVHRKCTVNICAVIDSLPVYRLLNTPNLLKKRNQMLRSPNAFCDALESGGSLPGARDPL